MNKARYIILALVVAGGLYATRSLDRLKTTESASTIGSEQNDLGEEIIKQKQAVPLLENQIKIQDRIITVDIADSPQERLQGLSGRDGLLQDSGMLFIFDRPSMPDFWMKEMNFSIDIVWIDLNGVIVGFNERVDPSTYPQTFSPPSQVKYVLEMSEGWISENKILEGAVVEGSMIK